MFAPAPVGVEDHVAAAARGLGPVHRRVGGLQEFVGAGVLGAGCHHADARGDGEVVAVDVERLGEGVEHGLGDLARTRGFWDQDDEFVAAHASDELARPGGAGAQAGGGLHEQRVADRVSEGVVDDLEMVEVDVAETEAAGGVGERGGEGVDETRPVRQAGQLIVVGPIVQMFPQRTPFGDVLHQHQRVLRVPVLVTDE